MTSTGSYEELFKKELSKYDHICEDIAQNIEAQEQLLLQIQVISSIYILSVKFPFWRRNQGVNIDQFLQ